MTVLGERRTTLAMTFRPTMKAAPPLKASEQAAPSASAAGRTSEPQTVPADIGKQHVDLPRKRKQRAIGEIGSFGDAEGDGITEGQHRIERGERYRVGELLQQIHGEGSRLPQNNNW